MKKIGRVLPCWLLALCLTGLALLAFPAAVAADTPVQNVPVPVSRWMVLNPATNKLYIDAYAGSSFLTVLNGSTYVTKSLAYPTSAGYVDAAVDPVNNRIYILPGSYLSNDPILVVNGATDTWTTSLPAPTGTSRRENKAIAVNPQARKVYFAEETTSSDVLVHQLNAMNGATDRTMTVATGAALDLAYNPVNGLVYVLTAHYQSGSWHHNTVWVLDVPAGSVLHHVDIDVQYAKLIVNERTGDVLAGRMMLNAQNIVVTHSLPAQARAVNPYTNKIYCFDNGGTLYEVNGLWVHNPQALRDFTNISPTAQGDALAINPDLNKLYLFSDQLAQMYVYDPARDLVQTLSYGMTRWALVNPRNHRLYIAPSRQSVRIFDGAPALNVSPAALNFVAVQDGADPPAQSVIVRMGASDLGNLRYTVASDVPWLTADKTGRFLTWYPVSDTLEAQVQVGVDITGLSASATPYVGQLTIASDGAKSSPRTVTVQLTVGDGASPLMQVDAANPARFEAMAGSAAPAPHTAHIRNLGAGSLTYAITEDIPWLDVTGPNPGSAGATALETVTLTVNSAFAALDPGAYTASLTVTSDSLGSPQVVNVELLIYPRPRLALNTNTLPFNAFVESGNPAWQYLYVLNEGAGILDWTATPNGAWVRTQGALNGRAPGAFQVGADIAALDLGLYHGNVAVSSESPGVEGNPQIADVVLHVDTARRMALSTVRLDDFAFVQGQTPSPQTFRIYNAGSGGAFDWQAESNAPWLILGATSGTADESGTTVQASVNPALLAVGAHQATITVRGDRVKGGVQTIRVLAFVASPSAPSCLPGVHLDLVKTSLLQIAVDIASVDAYHGAACDITADVELNLPGLKRTFRAPGSISAANALLVPLPGTLRLALAGVGLNLSSVQIANDGLMAQGQWDFGGVLGQTCSAGVVRIGKNGFTFDGVTTFPINQTWNFEGFRFSATQGRLRTAQSFDDFVIEVDGELTIKILGSRDVKVNLTLAVSRNGVQATGGAGEVPLPNFSFSLVGFTVQTREARFANGRVRIGRGEIRTPANWGGQGADIYDITIDGHGRVSVGGGKFRLPALKAGGLNLMSLEGALRESTTGYLTNGVLQPAAGYEIQARGEFGVPGMGGGGACSMMVDITVAVDVMGALVLDIVSVEAPETGAPEVGGSGVIASRPLDVMSLAPAVCVDESAVASGVETPDVTLLTVAPSAIDSLRLRQATLGMHCLPGVPLGNTGFFITGVQGSITLHDRIESVSLKMWIEHGVRLGNASLLSTDPQLTLYFSPFAIDFNAGIRVLNVRVADTRVYIDKNRFSTSISYNYLIVHGSVSFSAGTHNGKSYIAGSGRNSIGIKKGTIGRICIGICVKLPPTNLNLGSIGIDFGTFRNDKFGIKGTLKVWKWRGSVFVGFNGGIKFGKLRDYQLIGAQRVQQARAAYTAMQALAEQGVVAQLPLDPDLSFAPNGDTLVRVVIPSLGDAEAISQDRQPVGLAPLFAGGALAPSDVISTVTVLSSDVVFALAQPPDGKLEFVLVNPYGTTITPDMLPTTVEYVQAISDEDIQSMYFVEDAYPGEWKVRIIGDTDNTDFVLAVLGNTPAPRGLAVIQATGPTTATVAWIAQVAMTPTNVVNFYAHSGPLTRTVTYTGSQGAPYTVVEEVFEGVRVAEGLTATTGTQGYAHTLDLSVLPSGVYALWMEVEDDENPALRWYIRTGITSGPVATVTVNHASFPTHWTATLGAGLGIAEGDMQIAWIANAHPDTRTYTLHLTTTHPLTPTLLESRVFTASDVVYNSVEIVRIDNILPGQFYTFRIGAHHRQDGRVAWSPTFGFTTPQPEFILAAPTTPITVPAGQTASAVLTLYIADDLPFPVALAPGYIAAPDGFTLSFTPEVITTTGAMTATVQIKAVSGMYTGTYAVPVIAQSGALVRGAALEVTVLEATVYPVYLPVVMR